MSIPRSCTSAIRFGILVLVVFAPVAFGGDHIIPITCIEIAALALFVVWAVGAAFEGELRFLKNPLSLPVLAFLALVLVQLVLSHPLTIERFRGRAAVERAVLGDAYLRSGADSTSALSDLALDLGREEATGEGAAAPNLDWFRQLPVRLLNDPMVGSVYYHGSLTYLCRLLTYILIFFLVTQAFRTEQELGRLVTVLVFVGVGEALYGLFQYLSGADMLLWIKRKHFLDSVTGTYVNRNHFAGYMELVLPMAFASALLVRARSWRRRKAPLVSAGGLRGWIAALGRRASETPFLLIFVSIVMATALIFSRSRGGIAAFFLSVTIQILFMTRRRGGRGVVTFVAAVLVLVVVAGLWVGMQSVVERFSETYAEIAGGAGSSPRVSVWKDSVGIAARYPLMGTGFGTYQYVFPRYQTSMRYLFFDHAHNDYLEVLTDTGAVGLALVVWCIVGFLSFFRVRRLPHFTGSDDPTDADLRAPFLYLVGGGAGVTAMLIHSFVDFNLHIPANALTFAVVVGIVAVSWKLSCSPPQRSWIVPLSTVTARVALVFVVCLIGAAVGKAVIWMYADSRQAARLTALAEAGPAAGERPEPVVAAEMRSYDADLWYAWARYAMSRYQGRRGRFEKLTERVKYLTVAQEWAEVAAWLNPVASRYYLLGGWAGFLRGGQRQPDEVEGASSGENRGKEDELFRRAVVFGPYDTDILYSVGTYLLARGRKQPAIALYARANFLTRVNLPDSQLGMTLATLFRHTQQYEALEAIVPRSESAARAMFAEFLIEKGLFGEGVQERGRAAELFVSDGGKLFREGQYEQAATAYARARELDHGNVRSLAGLARCQTRMGSRGRALETLDRLLLEADGETDALSEALTALEELAAVHSYDPTVHLLLGVARQKLGQGERAVEVLRRALALEPRYNSNPLLHATMGRGLRQLGDLDGAREELERAASL